MGKTYLTEDEVRDIIREETEASSLRKVAVARKISPAYLSDILAGNRGISEHVAELFGFNRLTATEVKFQRQG